MAYNSKLILPPQYQTPNPDDAIKLSDEVINEPNCPSPIQIVNPWSMDVNTSNLDPDHFNYELKKQQPDLPLSAMDNLKFILEDVLAGDPNAANRPEFNCLNIEAIKAALDWLANTGDLSDSMRTNLFTDAWRLTFRDRPPTPEEFLTNKYIGPMADNVYPHIKKWFCEYLDPLKPYRTVILYSCIGSGKSLITVLTNLFISVHFALMWHPYKFFGQSVSTQYCNVLCATSMKKGSELLLEPMLNIIENASFFQKCRTKYDMQREEREFEGGNVIDHINWTTATPSSFLSMSNGLNYKLISDANGLLGQTIICGSITEFGFFIDKGWSDAKIMTFFTKLRKRIDSRMFGNYYGRFIVDSSPNTLESPIDDWILNTATKSTENYIARGARWQIFKDQFPEFFTDKTYTKEIHDFDHGFPLFKGGNGKPPAVIESKLELERYADEDIIWCPLYFNGANFKDKALENPVEFLKDWAGIPAGQADRIFSEQSKIDACFNNNLRSIRGSIVAPAEDEPEHLIWNQIKNKFFTKVLDKYYFYYNPEIPRVLSVDQSTSGDVTGIAVSHYERDPKKVDPLTGESMNCVVTDFTITIRPAGGYINLDAIKFFIIDLIRIGNMNIRHVGFDSFESAATRQFLKRQEVTVDYISVDKTNDAYLTFIDLVNKGRWHCGYNVYVENNMKSIQMTKRKTTGTVKIDHMKGDLVQDDSEKSGQNAKDNLDAIASNCQLLKLYCEEFPPTVIWDPGMKLNHDYEDAIAKSNQLLNKMGFIY